MFVGENHILTKIEASEFEKKMINEKVEMEQEIEEGRMLD